MTSSDLPSNIQRRSLVKGAAWAVPTVAVAASAPALAASSTPATGNACGTISYPTSSNINGQIVPISLSNGTTIYAKFTPTTASSNQSSNTSPNNMKFGKTAYGSTYGNYTISSANNLVLNQMSTKPSTESVTVGFFSDAAATQAVNVTNVSVPVNDFSAGASWNCGLFNTNCSVIGNQSYQDVVTLTGVTASGTTVAATSQGISGGVGNNATLPTPAGSLATGLYLPIANALAKGNSNGTSYGGTLNTTFGSQQIQSFTFGYSSNVDAATSAWTGAQGISIGTFTVCR